MSTASGKTADLSAEHLHMLQGSAIDPDVIEERGYRTVTTKAELGRLRFSDKQRRVPALLVPIWNVHGERSSYQIRPDEPRAGKDGKTIKYETPSGSSMLLDVPPRARPWLGDPSRPLFVTEGAKKADAAASKGLCCVDLLGVWNWRGTNGLGGKTALADWEAIALNGRPVYLAFDSDAATKSSVRAALARLAAFLKSRGAKVRVIHLPPGEGGKKVGLDDYFAAGGTVEGLLRLASDRLPEGTGDNSCPYRQDDRGIAWTKQTRDGEVDVPLTNFAAMIVADILLDDGLEQRRQYEIEAVLKGRTSTFRVPADRFPSMNWTAEHLGAQALVMPGQLIKDHARFAIQMLSDPGERMVYAHSGWRRVGGGWAYLHAGGAIGSAGVVEGIEVEMPAALQPLVLPPPEEGQELVEAARASLQLLQLGPDPLVFSLLAAVYRAPLGDSDYSVFLVGETGVFKTALAALCQQHYGAAFGARRLPGSWTSTENALEDILFVAKDALTVIDDFVSSANELGRLYAKAERVLRAQGNRSGRQRMRSDCTLRAPRPPRGLVLATGEDVPPGHSLRARNLFLCVQPGDVDTNLLTRCQQAAADGRLASAMSGYLRWLAPRYEEFRADLVRRQKDLRELAHRDGQHRRTTELIASLAAGLQLFLEFAEETGALDSDQASKLWRRGQEALLQAGEAQAEQHAEVEPCEQFLRLLGELLQAGKAHVADVSDGEGQPASHAELFGWRRTHGGCLPQGDRLGWVDCAGAIYLLFEPAYAAVQRLARDQGNPLPVRQQTLRQRLFERGYLASTETEGEKRRLVIRKKIGGARRRVLHLSPAALHLREVGQVGQEPASSEERCTSDGPPSGPLPRGRGQVGQEAGDTPEPARAHHGPAAGHRVGHGGGHDKPAEEKDLDAAGPHGPPEPGSEDVDVGKELAALVDEMCIDLDDFEGAGISLPFSSAELRRHIDTLAQEQGPAAALGEARWRYKGQVELRLHPLDADLEVGATS